MPGSVSGNPPAAMMARWYVSERLMDMSPNSSPFHFGVRAKSKSTAPFFKSDFLLPGTFH